MSGKLSSGEQPLLLSRLLGTPLILLSHKFCEFIGLQQVKDTLCLLTLQQRRKSPWLSAFLTLSSKYVAL